MRNYEPNADQIVALYQQLEDDILRSMIRRMLKMGFVSGTTAYQAEVLQTAGLLYDDIVQLIADQTDASTAQVRALFEDAGVQTVEIDNEIHESAGEVPVDIRQDGGMKQVLEAGYKKPWVPCEIWLAQQQQKHKTRLSMPVTGRICRFLLAHFLTKKRYGKRLYRRQRTAQLYAIHPGIPTGWM